MQFTDWLLVEVALLLFNFTKISCTKFDFDHGGRWSNRTYVALALFSLLATCVVFWGVGRGPTLAWPGWKQPDISVKVDTARLEAGQFKKCCMECVLLYYPNTEF
jgi:hypothetical protein